jgi:uncharacterized RDD family membrane protein YckC
MNWYYVEKGRQAGPVPEEKLLALIREGTVCLDTLLWREGMEQWKALQDLGDAEPPFLGAVQAALAEAVAEGRPSSAPPGDFPSGEGQALCAECRRVLSTGDMIPFGEQWVCADCKPLFFQRIREGVQPAPTLRYAGFWVRLLATFMDVIALLFIYFVYLVAMVPLSLVVKGFLVGRTEPPLALLYLVALTSYALFLATPMLYESLFTGRFGATLGKMLCGLRVVRPDGARITYGRSFARCFAKWLSYLTFYIGFIIAGFDGEKRALHDHICSTRVVRKG